MRKLRIWFVLSFLSSACFSQGLESSIRAADSLMAKSQYAKVIKLYAGLPESYPGNKAIQWRLVDSYYYSSQYESCIAAIDRLLPLEKDNEPQKYMLCRMKADCYYLTGNWPQAIEYYRKYTAVYPKAFVSLVRKGNALYTTKNYNEALGDYRIVANSQGVDLKQKAHATAMMAQCYLAIGEVPKARLNTEVALGLYADAPAAVKAAGLLSWRDKDYTNALIAFNKCLKLDTADKSILFIIGNCYQDMKDYKKAIGSYQKYLAREKGSAGDEALLQIGNCYFEMQSYAQAGESYKLYLLRKPESCDAYCKVSWAYYFQKKYAEALPFANKAVKSDPKSTAALDTRGCIYYKNGDYTYAMKDFDDALRIQPTLVNSHYFRGLCYLKLNRKIDACSEFDVLSDKSDYVLLPGELPVTELMSSNCK